MLGPGSRVMIVRRVAVVAIALLLAVQIVRDAAVAAYSELYPQTAARLWAGHPVVALSLGLAEIGSASRARRAVAPATFAMIDDAARKAPLSPQPFLVHGVRAQLAGDGVLAERNFRAAQWRRSMPAAYFLADYYLRNGKPLAGLRETSLVARLGPGGASAVAPFLAAYARNPANWPQIRALFKSDPTIEDGVLYALASDPDNADALLALADPSHRENFGPWLPTLLSGLVREGEYRRARSIWLSVPAVKPAAGALLFDAEFSNSKAPPPFNWTLTSSSVGLAERQPANRLHLLFYGQEDGVLAKQLLLLAPGSYRLRLTVNPGAVHPELLSWAIRCDKPATPVASTNLDGAARGWTFTIPANCPAQWLELSGTSGDVAQQADVTIGGLAMTPGGGGA